MQRFKVIFPLICLVLIGILMTTTSAFSQVQKRFPGCWYAEVEPFLIKVKDGLSELQFARISSEGLCHEDDFVNLHNKEVLGIYVAAGYDFSSCSACRWGLSLGYTYFDKNNHDSHPRLHDGEQFISTLGLVPFGGFTNAHGSLDTTYHAVDLLVNYRCLLCNCTQLNFFGGLRYVNIDEELKANFDFTSDQLAFVPSQRALSINLKNELHGAGPEIGIDIYAPFNTYFGVTGQIAGFWLRVNHNQDFNAHFTNTLANLAAVFDSNTFDSQNDHKWIPALSVNTGLDYQTMFCNWCLEAELGYRYDVYYKLNQEDFNDCDCTCANQQDRFEFQGPYLKLSWHF